VERINGQRVQLHQDEWLRRALRVRAEAALARRLGLPAGSGGAYPSWRGDLGLVVVCGHD
jgi:hypothetical protein